MVHQLSLVSSIPHSSYVQTISTLQALTGLSSPQVIATYTLLTCPHNSFKPKVEPGKVNQIEQYNMRCTTTWADETSETFDILKPVIKNSTDLWADRLFVDDATRQWTLQIGDIPNAGKNQACSAQNIHESTLVHHHTKSDDSFLTFLGDLGYDVINQYWIKGVRFFHGDVIIEIFKVFIRDDSQPSQEDATPESKDKLKLKLLDESNTFQIKVYTNCPKATDVDMVNSSIKELLKLQDFFKNLFKLEIPDRMHMDSRISRQI